MCLLIAVSIEYGRYPAAMIDYVSFELPRRQVGHDSTGNRAESADTFGKGAKSAAPRFFSPEHRTNNINQKKCIFVSAFSFRTLLQSSRVLALRSCRAFYQKAIAHRRVEGQAAQPPVAAGASGSGCADIRAILK